MPKYIQMWVEENYHYFETTPILQVYGKNAQRLFGYGVLEAVTFAKDFHVEFYLSQEELKRNRTEGYLFFSNPEKFGFLLEKINETDNAMQQQIRALLKQNLASLNNDQLWQRFDEYGAALSSLYTCYSMTQPHKFPLIEEKIVEFLQSKGVTELAIAISILTTPPTQIQLNNNENFLQRPFSETLQGETAAIDRTVLEQQLFTERKNNQNQREILLKKLEVPSEIAHHFEVLRVLGNERLKMRLAWMTAIYYNELFLIEIKRRHNIPKFEIRHYDYDELKVLVQAGKKLSPQKLKERELGIAKELYNGKIKAYEGKKAQEFIQKIGTDAPKSGLRGTVACKGHATGKVVLFSYKSTTDHSERVKKMGQGDIIVTEMTRPNIILACQKAGAIVTDEGGLLCHAAIVSRELNIPCVIGTKNATKLFKDGDYVKVDAENGIVRKITKTK